MYFGRYLVVKKPSYSISRLLDDAQVRFLTTDPFVCNWQSKQRKINLLWSFVCEVILLNNRLLKWNQIQTTSPVKKKPAPGRLLFTYQIDQLLKVSMRTPLPSGQVCQRWTIVWLNMLWSPCGICQMWKYVNWMRVYICVHIAIIKRASSGPPCYFGEARLVLSIQLTWIRTNLKIFGKTTPRWTPSAVAMETAMFGAMPRVSLWWSGQLVAKNHSVLQTKRWWAGWKHKRTRAKINRFLQRCLVLLLPKAIKLTVN